MKRLAKTILMTMSLAAASLLNAHAQMMPQCNSHFYYAPDTAMNSLQFLAANNAPGASFAWDFGDGGTANTGYTTHTFAGPGTYYVCLTVSRSDSSGNQLCSETHCDSVHVMAPPPPPTPTCNAHYIYHQSFQSGVVHFEGSFNANGTTYAWDFGDGSTGSGRSTDHTYATAGAFYVCLTVTTTDSSGAVLCSDNHCDSIHVQAPPPPPTPTCNAHFFGFSTDSVNAIIIGMNNRPNATYSWDLGDGSTDTGRVVHHTYAAPGTYYVCLTVATYDSTGTQLCTANWCDSIRTGRHGFHGHGHHWGRPEGAGHGHSGHRDSFSGSINEQPSAVFFPNPMTEKSVLHLENFDGAVSVKVMDQSGRIVSQNSNVTNGDLQFDRSTLKAGMYYYEVVSGDNAIQGKFIIQ